jgi:polyketide synthase PksL
VDAAVSSLIQRHGRIDGILHLAGVVQDSFILRKDISTIGTVLTPKISGAINLDYATRDISLEFMAFFSSIAGLHGNVGQADYSGANAFLDAFAEYRQSLTKARLRKGKTLAIAWPLWRDGGMQIDPVYIEAQRRQRGLEPMPDQAGFEAFRQILSSTNPPSCVSVNWGVPEKIRALIDASLHPAGQESVAEGGRSGPTNLRLAVIAFLKKILGEAIHLPPDKINETRKLEDYGLDSLITVELTTRLEETFGPLSKTLFFEYVNLRGIAGYFVENHADAARKLLSADDLSSESVESAAIPAALPESPGSLPEPTASRDVAVIGLSGRYPGAETLEEFWALLRDGKDAFEKIPAERWDNEAIYSPRREILGKTVIRNGTFLKDIDKFDPRYFHISQRDAELMSPEVRLFLQLGVQALEDAGYSREYLQRKYDGDVAVLAGTMSNHYNLYGFENNLLRGAPASGSYTGTLPNMLSYFYGFTGPSIFVDTMCSGSSTCIHQAVQMLRAGECRMAVAGGINLILHPYNLISSSQESFTTSTAEVIRSYGLGADGTILGEGAGVVVLKSLDAAVEDGDYIYAVIKGTAITNAGVRNGFTVPNPRLQALAITKALDDAKVDARSISYLEGHGSGTSLGDPIEIKGLSIAYEKRTTERQFCPIGSVKSNIAHLLAAAGIAGFTKVLLQLAHRQIVPSLHSADLNPAIPFGDTAFYVQRQLSDWKKPVVSGQEVPRRAGITSIGAGGMNSHIIVEEFSGPTIPSSPALKARLFLFSAASPGALIKQVGRIQSFLADNRSIDLFDLAY